MTKLGTETMLKLTGVFPIGSQLCFHIKALRPSPTSLLSIAECLICRRKWSWFSHKSVYIEIPEKGL